MPPRAERGLTLVEMLVVLAIVGVMAGATVLAIGAGGGDRATKAEATRLAAMLRLATDDVRLAERPLAFAWDAHGYAFVGRDPRNGEARPDRVTQLGTRHDLPGGMTLQVADVASPLAIVGDGSGAPIEARLASGSRRALVRYDGLDAIVADRAP